MIPDSVPAKHPGGRPRLDDAEKQRRGTFEPGRAQGNQGATRRPRRPNPTASKRPFLAVADRYAADVASGAIVACRWVQLAVERQARDRARAETDPSWPYVWSDRHARHACAFFEQLPHVEGRWRSPTITLEPWQVWFLTCAYGWRWRADLRRRRFTNWYLETGRKSAKSTLHAGAALYHLLEEDEPGAQVVCGATTGQQARIVFGIAQAMVNRSAWLRARELKALANAIITPTGTIKPINAKASTQDGLNPSAIILDESHAQKFALHDVVKSAQGARGNPLLACPTTAGYDLLSVGYALHTQVTKVLEQVLTVDHLLGMIYTLDDGDDWRDERVWIKANPMLGVSPTLEWVRRYCTDAQATPALEAEFRVKVCSQWSNAAASWLSLTAWDACADPTLRLESFAGAKCWIGGDLAQLDDLAAVALVFERDDRLVGFVRLYLPELVVQERARAVPEYLIWVRDGLLILTDGNMIDYARIAADVRAWATQFAVQDIAFDQYGSLQLVAGLAAEGLPARIEAKNAKTCTPPARELETRIKHGRFRHDGHAALRWQASNVVVSRRTDDSILPKKVHAESPNKIDAIDALILAIGGWLRQAASKPPAYQMLVFG